MNLDPHQLVEVYRSPRAKACRERELVLRSRAIPFHVSQGPAGFLLAVPAAWAELAQKELAAYEDENVDWPPKDQFPVMTLAHLRSQAVYVGLIAVMFLLQRSSLFDVDWTRLGASHAEAVRHGELWRTVTSLTLHADLVHVLGNALYGALFGLLVCTSLGGGLGWATILCAGALGNLTNAWVQDPSHGSIGASTAVFAAVGIMAGAEWRRRVVFRERRLRRAAPLLAALLLLSYLGIGGERTDVLAHVTGLFWGLPLGALAARLADGWRGRPRVQVALGAGALGAVLLAWSLALASAG